MNNSKITMTTAANYGSVFFKLFCFLGLILLFPSTGMATNDLNSSSECLSSNDLSNSFCNLRVWFKNKGCKTMKIYRVENGRERHRNTVGSNGTAEFDATKGDRFIIRVDDKKIKDWKVPNCKDQTQMIDTKGCDEDCRVRIGFKNTGCNRLNIFRRDDNGRENQVGHINPNETTHVDAIKDQRFRFRTVEGGNRVKDWTVSKCNNSTENVNSGACAKQPNCKDINISTSAGKVKVKGLKKAPISEVQILRKNGRQVAGCRRCNKDSKTFRVDAGDYWVVAIYYDKSSKRICDVRKDVRVRDLADGEGSSASRIISSNTASTTQKTLSYTQLEQETPTTNTNTKIALDVEKDVTSNSMKVYPNPVSSVLFVELGGASVDQKLEMTLFNAQGRVVQTMVASATNTARFDLSATPAGIYLVKVQSEDGQSLTETVIIR